MTPSQFGSKWRLVAFGGVLTALFGAAAFSHPAGQFADWPRSGQALFLGLEAASVLVYFAAVALVLRRRHAANLAVILIVGVVVRIIALAEPPFLSTDIYRYVWDGRVQAAGLNPYRYIPADAALAPLRDAAIYPSINRKYYAHTAYPPMAQIAFFAFAKIKQTPLAIKIAMALCETVAMVIVLRLMNDAGIERSRMAIYAWNPVVVWEYAGNGHIDGLALAFVALALLAFQRRRDVLVGIALGAAILVKFLPAAIVPAFWRRWDWRMPASLVATVTALYLCYASAGSGVLGFLQGYVAEEGMASGQGISWLDLIQTVAPLPAGAGWLWIAVSALVLITLAVRIARRSVSTDSVVAVATAAAILSCGLMVLMTPHYAWYLAWLALPACFFPAASVIYLSAASFILYVGHAVGGAILYSSFSVLAALDWLRTRDARDGSQRT